MKVNALAHVLILMSLVCIFAMVMTYDSQAQKVDESLVLYLPFDEEKGDPQDLSQYEHEVKTTGKPRWTDGKLDGGLELDASYSIEVPITEELKLTEKFTVEFWAERSENDRGPKGNHMLGVFGENSYWTLSFNAGSRYRIAFDDGAPRLYSINPLSKEWMHVALVYDVDTAIIVYLNGVEDKRTPEKPPIINAGEGSITVGGFNGIMDEVAIYNRVLSPDEIKRDMAKVGGLAVSPPGKMPSTWGRIKI